MKYEDATVSPVPEDGGGDVHGVLSGIEPFCSLVKRDDTILTEVFASLSGPDRTGRSRAGYAATPAAKRADTDRWSAETRTPPLAGTTASPLPRRDEAPAGIVP